MDKYYIVKNKKILNNIAKYKDNLQKQKEFIRDFYERHGIDGSMYYISGGGDIDTPFTEENKKSITLCIEDTVVNTQKFGDELKKAPLFDNMKPFKARSKILRAFQDECIEKQIVINLYGVRWGDYFTGLHLGGYNYCVFEHNDELYLSLSSTRVDDTAPEVEGFEPIKGSEFHLAKEQCD